jgi:type II secretory pathway pseudopilin PulG/ribosomal protein L12E/L44/L45/RPP1/RPP2
MVIAYQCLTMMQYRNNKTRPAPILRAWEDSPTIRIILAQRQKLVLGLTLVEMVIAMAIMAIIFAAIVPQFRIIQNSWDSKQAAAETLQNSRVLMEHLYRNLSKAVRITAVSNSSETNGYIEFEDNDENIFRYDIAASNYVEFGPVGDLYELAGPVSQLQFTCYDGNDFDTAITDVNDIRFIEAHTTLTSPAAMGHDKTFTALIYLRANANSGSGGLVGWWKLDETSGLIAADSSDNGNDGSLKNMAGDEWTNGNIGGCLEFDGNNDYVECGDDESLNITDQITLSAWVWHDDFIIGQVERYITVRSEIAVIRKESDERLHFYINTDGSLRHLRVGGVLTEGYWYHIAGTWDGITQCLYLDGVEIDSQTPGGVLGGTFSGVHLSSSAESLNGLLDEVRIYNRALSAEEIASLANILTYKELTETKAGTNVSSITISTPSGTRESDLLIAAVATDGDTDLSLSPPLGEGWTQINLNDYGNEVTLGAWWKNADASESPSHQFTWSGDQQAYGWIMRFMGHETTDPIHNSMSDGENSSNPTSPSVTTTVDGCIILRIGAFDDDYITLNDPGLSGHTAITMDSSNRTDIYWADEEVDMIRRADLDGSNIEDLVTAATMKPKALALDLAGGKMYWADEEVQMIRRANLDGSNIEDLLTGIVKPRALALDVFGGKMYWADEDVDKIQRANLDGSNIEDLVTAGTMKPRALALDVFVGKMYWVDVEVGKIRRANLDGSNIEDLITSGAMNPSALVLDVFGGKMYWTDDGVDKIQRANLDGSNIEDLLTGVTRPKALGVDIVGGKMYWADEELDKIRRANLDGSNIENIITAAVMKPRALALALNETGSGTVSGGAGYVKQANSGFSDTSTFSLTASQESRAVTIAITPDPDGGGGGGIAP